jgi:hypothetical protein
VSHRFPARDVRALRARIDTGRGLRDEPVADAARAGGGVYAFGTLPARQWLRADRTIEQLPSRRTPAVRRVERLAVSLILPEGRAPRGGWPVAIFGHGFLRSQLDVFLAADRNARRGLATLALTIPGHGGGPGGRLAVDLTDGRSVEVALPGRAVDLDGNGEIGAAEGAFAALPPSPVAAVSLRDVLRQAALDVSALASAVRRGVDVDGDGAADLSRTRIGYYGSSLGAMYGTIAVALDRRLRPAALNVGGGPVVDLARLSPAFRPLVTAQLGGRVPSVLNGGRGGFTEADPLAGQAPVVDPPAGATAIQEGLARVRWIQRSGGPEAYAPALIGDRRILVQVAFGDRTVPNPTSAILIRAGRLEAQTALFRNDRTATAGRDPHGFLLDPAFGRQRAVAQDQVLDLLLGDRITDPDGRRGRVWEVPPRMELLDRLNFPPGA